MRRAAVFFDRDNTLVVNDGYLGDPAAVVLVDGAAQAVARAKRLGFAVVTVSNQSGVARGLFTEDAVLAVDRRMDEMLIAQDSAAVIDDHEYCPFHPQATVEKYRKPSPLRKPLPGMILSAAEKLSLDLSRSWLIGDALRDIEAGKAAGCRTILFRDPAIVQAPNAKRGEAVPDHIVQSLKEAMDIVEWGSKS
jgi:D,D-heptose 1,7-bisphosphate phosphatase